MVYFLVYYKHIALLHFSFFNFNQGENLARNPQLRRLAMHDVYFQGIYWFISELPILVTLSIFLFILELLPVGRGFFEGIPYDVSMASRLGDKLFVVVALIGVMILQRGPTFIPPWLQSGKHQVWVYFAGFAACIIISVTTFSEREGDVMDLYHDLFIAPIFLSLGIFLLPVIFSNGSRVEIGATLFLVFAWVGLGVYDVKTGRLKQRDWLQAHGVTFEEDLLEESETGLSFLR